MPELPEVETVCQGLRQSIIGKKITHVDVLQPKLRINVPEDIEEIVTQQRILDIERRAKYILISLSNQYYLMVHLGMSGKLLVHTGMPERKKHDHLYWEFEDGAAMVFHDPRRFGLVTLAASEQIAHHPLLAHLGVEPLTNDFSAAYLQQTLKNKSCSIKQAIMDSKLVVGVGNIYAAESLFRSRIHPETPSNKLNTKQYEDLAEHIRQVLQDAIASGGSTLRDYVRSSGDVGYFQHHFDVYGREDESCTICKTKIKRIKQQGRSSFFCPKCQRK